MKVFWISSYPKSGNTWVRFLLYHYLYGEIEKSDDVGERIPGIHQYSAVSGFGTPGETINMNLDRFRRFANVEGPLLCKSHYMLTPHHPLLKNTAGFIYILRNPRDVLLSNLNYAKIVGTHKGTSDSDRVYAEESVRNLGDSRWLTLGMGTWLDNVLSWLSAARAFPHAIFRYEDIKKDPEAALSRMVSLLGLEVDQAAVRKAVERSSFEQMRRLEDKERSSKSGSQTFGIGQGQADDGLRFLSQGKSGQSLTGVGAELERAFDDRFGELASLFGY